MIPRALKIEAGDLNSTTESSTFRSCVLIILPPHTFPPTINEHASQYICSARPHGAPKHHHVGLQVGIFALAAGGGPDRAMGSAARGPFHRCATCRDAAHCALLASFRSIRVARLHHRSSSRRARHIDSSSGVQTSESDTHESHATCAAMRSSPCSTCFMRVGRFWNVSVRAFRHSRSRCSSVFTNAAKSTHVSAQCRAKHGTREQIGEWDESSELSPTMNSLTALLVVESNHHAARVSSLSLGFAARRQGQGRARAGRAINLGPFSTRRQRALGLSCVDVDASQSRRSLCYWTKPHEFPRERGGC